MKSLRYVGLLGLAGLLVLLEGCAGSQGGGRRLTNADVTLVSFRSVQGELKPCG